MAISEKLFGDLAKASSQIGSGGTGGFAPDQGGGKVIAISRDGRVRYEGHVSNITTLKQRREMRKRGVNPGNVGLGLALGYDDKEFRGFHPAVHVASWNSLDRSKHNQHEKEMFLLKHGLVRDINSPDGYRRVPLNWMHEKRTKAAPEPCTFTFFGRRRRR